MTRLYPNLEALILEIEAESAKFLQDAEFFANGGKAHKAISARERAKGCALRDVAIRMRESWIGPNPDNAVMLTDLSRK